MAGEENAIDLNQGSITLAGTSRGAVLGYQALDSSDDGHLVNWARPTLAEAATSTDGRRLFLTFDEELNPDGSPPTSAFSVTVDGGAAPLSGTTASVGGRVVDSAAGHPAGLGGPEAERQLHRSLGRQTTWPRWRTAQGNDAASFRGRTAANRFGAVNRVLPDFALVPSGLGVGDSFRLLFVTSTTRDATATDIEVYNAFVQAAAAAGHADIQDYSAGFFAVASTADDDARDNTGTTYTSRQPGGARSTGWAATRWPSDYADFYDGDWDDEANATDESGGAHRLLSRMHGPAAAMTARKPSTAAAPWPWAATRATRRGSGRSIRSSRAYGPLAGLNSAMTRTRQSPLYGLSEVFTVVDAASITDVAIVSDPGSGRELRDRRRARGGGHLRPGRRDRGQPAASGCGWPESGESVRWAQYRRDPLVRNTGQPQFSGTALTAARPRLAQRFRTGGGVRELSAIGIKFHTIANPETAGEQLTVTLHADDNGNPAATPLCTLNAPAEFGATGLQTFDAPDAIDAPDACPDLAEETGYFVVVERVSFSAAETIAVWHTASPRRGRRHATSGWSIGDRGHTVHRPHRRPKLERRRPALPDQGHGRAAR